MTNAAPPALYAAAASSSIAEYRPNGAGSPTVRTLEALLGWAAGRGVTAPDWIEVRVAVAGYEPVVAGRPVPAAYFRLRTLSPELRIPWRSRSPNGLSIVDAASGKVVVQFRRSVLDSDEQFLHVLAHEVHEIARLREEYDATPGRALTVAALGELTRAEPGLNNLHSEAWDHADGVVRSQRAVADAASESDPGTAP